MQTSDARKRTEADCRTGHTWTEVLNLDSTLPVGFVCSSCDVALKAVPVAALEVGR